MSNKNNVEKILRESGVRYVLDDMFWKFNNEYGSGTNEPEPVLLDVFGKLGFLSKEPTLIIGIADDMLVDAKEEADIGAFVRDLVSFFGASRKIPYDDSIEAGEKWLASHGFKDWGLCPDLRFLGIEKEGLVLHVSMQCAPGGPVDELCVLPLKNITKFFRHPSFEWNIKKRSWPIGFSMLFCPAALGLIAEKEPDLVRQALDELLRLPNLSGSACRDLFDAAFACDYENEEFDRLADERDAEDEMLVSGNIPF